MCWQVGCLPATLFLVCRGPSLRVVLPRRVESRRLFLVLEGPIAFLEGGTASRRP